MTEKQSIQRVLQGQVVSNKGDKQSRPISKTKTWHLIEIVERAKG